MIDYLIVGLGLAGISYCETLERHNMSFRVFSDTSQTSSLVAGGMYNPVNLKRLTLAWMAQEQLQRVPDFYHGLERKLHATLDEALPVLRKFASLGEQNLWFEASDKSALRPYLSHTLITNKNSCLEAPFGFGRVLHTGKINTKKLVGHYSQYLLDKGCFLAETFDFKHLHIFKEHIDYKGFSARKIVFAEGFGMKKNPFFEYLPLTGTKGELLTIKAPDLKESNVIKSSIFIIPQGENCYRVGATFTRNDKSNLPTEAGRKTLLEKLDNVLRCDYEVLEQVAGIRPTVSDRRPLVGRHPKYNPLFVLNGFGSRGVMIGPYAADQLYRYSEEGVPLHSEMNIERFTAKHYVDGG